MVIDFEISRGDELVLSNGEKLIVDNVDDKYLYTNNGSQFKRNHPDIADVIRQEKKEEAEEPVPVIEELVEKPVEEKKKPSKKKK